MHTKLNIIWALGLFICGLLVFPGILHQKIESYQWDEIPMQNVNDETFYLSKIAYGLNGHFDSGDPSIAEHAQSVSTKSAWLEMTIGQVASFFSLKLHHVYWFNFLFFPVLWLILLYLLFLSLGSSRLVSACSALVIMCVAIGPYCFRTMHPRVSGCLFFLHLLVLFNYLKSPNKTRFLGAVLTSALQFYSYPFYWVFNAATCSIAGLILMFQKKIKMGWSVWSLILCAIPIAWPVFDNILAVTSSTAYDELIFRMGYRDATPVFSKSNWLWIGLLILWRPKGLQGIFLWAMAIAALICTNQQIITHSHPSSSRYIWYIVKPLLIFSVLEFFSLKLREEFRWKPKIFWIISLGALGVFIHSAIQWVKPVKEYVAVIDRYREVKPLVKWLNENTAQKSVVVCPLEISNLIPLYTENYVYATLNSLTQLISQKEHSQRLHALDFLQEITPEQYKNRLKSNLSSQGSSHYGSHFHRLKGGYDQVPEEIQIHLIQSYTDYFNKNKKNWQPEFQADYIVFKKPLEFYPPIQEGFQKIHSLGNYEIWKSVN